MYQKVSTDMNFAQREEEVIKFWRDEDIFKKTVKLREGAPAFTFFDGPPTANGKPHIGHVETRAIKDIIPRYRTMKGYDVLRKAGWDTHGLPVELEVEKMLGLDGKPQIEKYGIEPFIKECKKSVWKYKTEWEEMMARKVLAYTTDALLVDFRYMGSAIQILQAVPDGQITTLAGDGAKLHYSAEQLIRVFRSNEKYLNRLYLHALLHCLFQHLWIGGTRDRMRWHIACDIAVEYVIDQLKQPSVHRIIGWLREKTYRELSEYGDGISAAIVYRWLEEKDMEQIAGLRQEFFTDDHRYWPKQEQRRAVPSPVQNKWQQAARKISLEQKRQGDDPQKGQRLLTQQMKEGRSRRSYRDFLKKFAVYQEELTLDPDEFDLNFYTYGLRLYGNLPLVEPVESSEVCKILDFVVVVDTSYSTSGVLVQGFLQETFQILTGKDSFFRKARIWVLQCDETVQKEDVICSKEELDRLFTDFEIYGGGGTDFRPAFERVQELIEQGAFERLCGLLYFTDGKGIYPTGKPPYKTAFLFLNDYEEEKVPVWAMRLKVDEGQWQRHADRMENNDEH